MQWKPLTGELNYNKLSYLSKPLFCGRFGAKFNCCCCCCLCACCCAMLIPIILFVPVVAVFPMVPTLILIPIPIPRPMPIILFILLLGLFIFIIVEPVPLLLLFIIPKPVPIVPLLMLAAGRGAMVLDPGKPGGGARLKADTPEPKPEPIVAAAPPVGGGGSENEETLDWPMVGRWSSDIDEMGVLSPLPVDVVLEGKEGVAVAAGKAHGLAATVEVAPQSIEVPWEAEDGVAAVEWDMVVGCSGCENWVVDGVRAVNWARSGVTVLKVGC